MPWIYGSNTKGLGHLLAESRQEPQDEPYRGAGAPKVTRHKCDERCLYAQPHSPCSCSCGGINHARGWIEESGQESLFDNEEN